jgi:hypothetical protein
MRYSRGLLLLTLSVALPIGAANSLQAQTPIPLADVLLLTPTPVRTGTSPVSIKPIEYSQTVEGSLEPDNTFALYTFRGQQGDAVTIAMKSWTLNAYLTLIDSSGSEIAWDDDSGGYPDALLGPYILPQTGDYQIRASSNSEPHGTFTLHLDKVEVEPITLGQSADATFTERAPAVYFTFDGKVGDVLTIVVNSDEKLDTRLRVRGVGDSYDLIADDDSGAGFDPEISRLIIPDDDQYIIAVEPYAPGMTGTVRLHLEASPLASLEDGTQTISLGSKRSRDVVTFEGRMGEQVRLTVVVTNGRPDYMTIRVTQHGQEITSISSSFVGEVSFLVTTPFDGRVNVQFENSTNMVLEVTLERV